MFLVGLINGLRIDCDGGRGLFLGASAYVTNNPHSDRGAGRVGGVVVRLLAAEGEGEFKTTIAVTEGDGDRTSVECHRIFDNRQAHTRAARFARATLVDAVESLEKSAQMFGLDAHSVVRETYCELLVTLLDERYEYMTAKRIRYRIVGQISENRREQLLVADHCQRSVDEVAIDEHSVCGRLQIHIDDDLAHDGRKVDLAAFDVVRSVVEAGERRYLLQQLQESFALSVTL